MLKAALSFILVLMFSGCWAVGPMGVLEMREAELRRWQPQIDLCKADCEKGGMHFYDFWWHREYPCACYKERHTNRGCAYEYYYLIKAARYRK